jgi:ribosome-associated protein
MTRTRAGQRVSKTQRKKDSEALQQLGEALIGLPATELERLGLPDRLREAVMLAGRLTSHGGLRRQRQYIGRLMRDVDPAPVRAYLEQRQAIERAAQHRFRRAERWRDRLLGDDEAVLAVCAAATGAEIERLRDLRRTARHAHSDLQRTTARRALFRYLHGLERDAAEAGG